MIQDEMHASGEARAEPRQGVYGGVTMGSGLPGETDRRTVAAVLAAGLGKRMRSALPKVLHEVGGRPMLLRVLAAVRQAGVDEAIVVTGNGASAVEDAVASAADLAPMPVRFARQQEQRGTGHAALQALSALPRSGESADTVLVLPGDAPLLDADVLRGVLLAHHTTGAAATLLTARMQRPDGYGRVLRDGAGQVVGIVEDRDATPEQRRIQEINTLVACFDRARLEGALALCRTDNAQGEIYLPDTVGILHQQGYKVEAILADDADSALGVNDRRALATAEATLRRRVLEGWMDAGVTVVDPLSTYVDDAATLGQDCVLLPGTVIQGPCDIGAGCRLGPGAHIRASRLEHGCIVWHSVIEHSELGPDCRVGPFAHLRPGSRLGARVDVGNFAEVKNARLGDGTKQHHHSYIGDADVGVGVNVGAGAITVNFDGRRKHRTVIGDGAFLGCNANLVAPVQVGAGAFIGAGTTVTRNIPDDALAVGRPDLQLRLGWAARRREGSTGPEKG